MDLSGKKTHVILMTTALWLSIIISNYDTLADISGSIFFREALHKYVKLFLTLTFYGSIIGLILRCNMKNINLFYQLHHHRYRVCKCFK